MLLSKAWQLLSDCSQLTSLLAKMYPLAHWSQIALPFIEYDSP
jgi:hypothetical protein